MRLVGLLHIGLVSLLLPALTACSLVTTGPIVGAEGQAPLSVDTPTATSAPAIPTATSAPTVTPASTSTPVPTATPAPPATPEATATPLPLSAVWDRLRGLQFVPALNDLQPLPANERDDPLFAIDDALVSNDASAYVMRGVGTSIDRVEVRWDLIEPQPDVFDFSQTDALMEDAKQLDYSVLAVVDGTPEWAVTAGQTMGSGVPRDLGAAALLPDGSVNPANPWAVFLATVARRYGTRVGAWEVWNEPNTAAFWQGSVADYAQLLSVSRQVLRHERPNEPVLIGGLVPDGGQFLTALTHQLCPSGHCQDPPYDAVAWHVYNNPNDAPLLAALTNDLLGPFGLSPPVWITEANVPVDDPQSPPDAVVGPDAVSLEQQAAFVVQLYALARAAGVQTVAMYRASDVDDQGHYWGLLRSDGTGRPALFAYATTARWLNHTRFLQPSHPQPNVTVLQYCRPGQRVTVAWTDSPEQTTVSLPALAPAGQLVSATGQAQPIEAIGGVFRVLLAPASHGSKQSVPLAPPIFLVVPTMAGC